ncbi:hypothetical protein [Luteimonas huabeiensis]|uniref:hypothetical protein n=1 Tax=Luteimonas huabeiensis TaxID=1244513 RepID=UPI000467E774|nr:hypothetical protein [Luteimonas huabeiensis]
MSEFLSTALGYPTLVYSVALAFCVLYWLLAATGLVDLDLDALDGVDVGEAHGVAGVFARLGLDRVPIMAVLTLLALVGWLCTYFVHLLLLAPLSGWLRWLAGTVVALLALVPATLVTAAVLRPVRRWLLALRPPTQQSLLGRVAVVRSPEVSASHGSADLDDGGAGLILQVRSDAAVAPRRGDRVVLVEFNAPDNTYRVVPEDEFRHI